MESPDEKAHSRTVLPTITRTDDEVAKVPTKTTHPPSTQSPSTHPAEQRSPPAAAPAKKKPRLIGPAARPPTEPSVGANDRNSRDQVSSWSKSYSWYQYSGTSKCVERLVLFWSVM